MLRFLLICFLAATLSLTKAQTIETKTKPVTSLPSTLDVITFAVHADGENHKMVITLGAPLVRIDEPDDRYSLIYDPPSQDYIGLEHGNYTYWEFAWPAVQAQVTASQRGSEHLRDLVSEGSSGYAQPAAGSANDPDSSSFSDSTNFIWRQTTDKKNIAGLDCGRWTGTSATGETVEAWCFAGVLPKIRAAMEQVRAMNEPMALVPVRTLVPTFVFPVYDALVRGGATPVEITWGGDSDKNRFSLVETKTRAYKPALFAIPKLYIKTTLVTMDGITNPVKEKR